MIATFGEIQARAQRLADSYGGRNAQFKKYEDMYLMKWEDKPAGDGVKITISPDARNAVLGAVRLLIATDPIFHIDRDKKDKTDTKAELIEKLCSTMWAESGRVTGMPIHYDAILSAVLYGEVHIAISNMAEMVKLSQGVPASKTRAERIASRTPFIFEAWNPKEGYPEFDALGLRAYYRKVNLTIAEVQGRFGKEADSATAGKDGQELIELSIWYDMENYCVWAGGQMIKLEAHKLPNIPISVVITEGSRMFPKAEDQRQPLLFGLDKSMLHERSSLALTVLFTHLFDLGINPLFKHRKGQSGNELDMDVSSGVIELEAGEDFEPVLRKGIVDDSFQVALQITEQKTGESTIYKQAMGQAMTGSPAFSTVALMSQAGRLPLISTQKQGAWGIGRAMEIALDWYRESGGNTEFDVKPSDIPVSVRVNTKLDINLPQDKLQLANIATMLVDKGLVNSDWARSEILNIENTSEMQKEIWKDLTMKAMVAQTVQQLMQQQQQQQMMQAQQMQGAQNTQPGMPPGMPGQMPQGMPPGMPPGMPQGMPPGMPPGMPQGQQPMPAGPDVGGQGFNPAMGGQSPTAAGMIPEMGQAVAPDGMQQ